MENLSELKSTIQNCKEKISVSWNSNIDYEELISIGVLINDLKNKTTKIENEKILELEKEIWECFKLVTAKYRKRKKLESKHLIFDYFCPSKKY